MTRKTVVITGCSSGFGRCTALELARHGWLVFATVRKEEDRASLLQEAESQHCRGTIMPLLCDITNTEQVVTLARQVQAILYKEALETSLRQHLSEVTTVPPLDALVNNAGTAYGAPIEILPLDDLRAQLEVNVVAQVGVMQVFLPMLKAAHGTIINVSSISGRLATPALGAYCASKFALEGLSEALRLELLPFGVRVVLIEPASSPTHIWKTSLQRSMDNLGWHLESSPYARLLQMIVKSAERSSKKGFPPRLFAALVVKILASHRPRARYGVPGSATAIILLRRFLPDGIWDRLIRSMMRW